MAKDFRANQIRTAQIIGSGSDWPAGAAHGPGAAHTTHPNLGLLIYSSSAASDYNGGIVNGAYDGDWTNRPLFSEFGDEPWLVISGTSTANQDNNLPSETGGSVLFMGDVIISGTLFGKRQIIVVDKDVPGDLYVQNNTHLSGNLFVGPTAYSGSNPGGPALGADAVGKDIFFAFKGDMNTAPMVSFRGIDATNKTANKGTSYPASNAGTGNDTLTSGPGSDTFFYVSGSTDSLNKRFGGASVFGGDLLVSGNIIVNGTNNILEFGESIILNNSQSMTTDAPSMGSPVFGHDFSNGSTWGVYSDALAYDRWKVNVKYPGSSNASNAEMALSHDFESIIQTSNGLFPMSFTKRSNLVLSSSYSRMVLSGTGEIAISRVRFGGGNNGGKLRFLGSGSGNDTHGIHIEATTGSVVGSNEEFIFSNKRTDGTQGAFVFNFGTITASHGISFPSDPTALQTLSEGQTMGLMFAGKGTTSLGSVYSDAGLFYNEDHPGKVNPFLKGPLNTLVLTASNAESNLFVGAGKVLTLRGTQGIKIGAGVYDAPDAASGNDADFTVNATGQMALTSSSGMSLSSGDSYVRVKAGINVANQDIILSGSGTATLHGGTQVKLQSKALMEISAYEQDPASSAGAVVNITSQNAGTGGGRVFIDAKDEIKIGTLQINGQYPDITIGNVGSSEITDIKTALHVSGDGIFEGSLEVRGDFIKGHVISASISDPILLLNSGSVSSNTGGGIAIASGSASRNQAMVFGRDTVFADTFIVGRLDVKDDAAVDPADRLTKFTGAVPIAVHASALRLDAGIVLSSSAGGGVGHLTMSSPTPAGTITIKAGNATQGNVIFSGSQFSLQKGKKLYFDEGANTRWLEAGSSEMNLNLAAGGLVLKSTPAIHFGASNLSINGGQHADSRGATLYISASTISGNPGNVVVSGSHHIMLTGSSYSFKMGQNERLYLDESTTAGGPYYFEIDSGDDYLSLNAATGDVRIANTIAMDATNVRLGINATAPAHKLDLSSTDFIAARLQNTANDANGAILALQNNRGGLAVSAAEDTTGRILFYGGNSNAGNLLTYSALTGYIDDPTASSEKGRVELTVKAAGVVHKTLVAKYDQVLILSGGHGTDVNEANATDLAFFVSGSIGNRGHQTVKGTAMFGGDVVMSGNLDVKTTLTASVLSVGSLTLSDTNPVLGFNDESAFFIKKNSTNLEFRDTALGITKTLSQLASVSVEDNSIVFTVIGGEPSYVITSGSFSFDTDERPTNVTPAPGGPGADTYLFVSGARGGRNALATGLHQRSVAVFGGDVYVSGSLKALDSVFGGSLDDAYDTPNGGGDKIGGSGNTVNVLTHAPITFKQDGSNYSTSSPLLQLSGGIKIGQMRIAPASNSGTFTNAIIFNTASNGQITFGWGGVAETNNAFKINESANILIAADTSGNGKKLAFSPSEASTFFQYTNNNAANPGPRVLHMKNLTTDGRISLAMGASGTAAGSGYEGILAISGSIEPGYDNVYNLGSADKRFANLYTGDLHLRNDRGNWTIYEEPDMLVVVNNLTGKKYKMGLTPLEDDE